MASSGNRQPRRFVIGRPKSDGWAKRELLEVLKKVGTAKCESFLEKQATSNDASLRNNAQQALDAVRSRL